MDSIGEGEGGKIWENGIQTCKISCMKKINKIEKKIYVNVNLKKKKSGGKRKRISISNGVKI